MGKPPIAPTVVLVNGGTRIPGSVTSGSSSLIYVTFNFNGKPPGYYNLTLTAAWGRSGTKERAVILMDPASPPIITQLNPGIGVNNANLSVVISGAGFKSPKVYLNQGSICKLAPATAGKKQTDSTLYVTLPLIGLPGGYYNITAANDDGVNGTASDIFYLTDLSKMGPQRSTVRSGSGVSQLPDTGSIPSGGVNPVNRRTVGGVTVLPGGRV